MKSVFSLSKPNKSLLLRIIIGIMLFFIGVSTAALIGIVLTTNNQKIPSIKNTLPSGKGNLTPIKTDLFDFSSSDPIKFDPFSDYGKEELWVMATTSGNWDVMRNNIISSFHHLGKPNTESLLQRNENNKITYDANKNVANLPLNVKRVIKVFDENEFDELTPVRNNKYTYVGFLTAVHKYPRFCAEKNDIDPVLKSKSLDDVCKAEISTMFAHFAQEVGGHYQTGGDRASVAAERYNITLNNPDAIWPQEQWKQGLFFLIEIAYSNGDSIGYRQCDDLINGNIGFPCFDGKSYHGRGAKQLSWNYNYGPFSRAMYGPDQAEVLLQDPDRVAKEGWLALASGMHFYMTPRSPKPSIHDTVVGRWLPSDTDKQEGREKGFGVTINIINGGLECNKGTSVATAANRESYFQGIAEWFNIYEGWYDQANYANNCINMQSFKKGQKYDYEPSWGQDFNNATQCRLYSWEEGMFTPLVPGDYYRCQQATRKSNKSISNRGVDYKAGKNATYTMHRNEAKKLFSNVFLYNPPSRTPEYQMPPWLDNSGNNGGTQTSIEGEPKIDPVIISSENQDYSTSDPVIYDVFANYGKEEIEKIASTSSWETIKTYKVGSYFISGKPNTEEIVQKNAQGLIDYESNKNNEALPSNVLRVIKVFPEEKWNELTPVRNKVYTYVGYLTAVHKYPRFCAEKNDSDPDLKKLSLEDVCRGEIANMFAHFAQEVGGHDAENVGTIAQYPGVEFANTNALWPQEQWKQGLVHVTEVGWTKDRRGTKTGYRQCNEGATGDVGFPCFDDQSYHGRGAKQLSYNYNYGPFSRVMYGPTQMEVLLRDPEKVAEEGWLALASAMYFYMTPREPKPSIHDTVVGRWQPSQKDVEINNIRKGFGVAINIINGGVECGGAAEVAQAKNRKDYFIAIAKWFGVWEGWFDNPSYKHTCINMKQFDGNGPTSAHFSWTANWDGSNTCQLVKYEAGPFNVYMPGDYYRCNKALQESTKNTADLKSADYRVGKDATYTMHKDLSEADKLYKTGQTIFDYVYSPPAGGGNNGGTTTPPSSGETRTPTIVGNEILTDEMLNDSDKENNYSQGAMVCRSVKLVQHPWGSTYPSISYPNGLKYDPTRNDGCVTDSGDFIGNYRFLRTVVQEELIFYFNDQWYWNIKDLSIDQALGLYGYTPDKVPTFFHPIKRA